MIFGVRCRSEKFQIGV